MNLDPHHSKAIREIKREEIYIYICMKRMHPLTYIYMCAI